MCGGQRGGDDHPFFEYATAREPNLINISLPPRAWGEGCREITGLYVKTRGGRGLDSSPFSRSKTYKHHELPTSTLPNSFHQPTSSLNLKLKFNIHKIDNQTTGQLDYPPLTTSSPFELRQNGVLNLNVDIPQDRIRYIRYGWVTK